MVKDLRDIIEQAKWLLLSKNDGQVLQEFIWAVTNGAKENKDLFKKDDKEKKEEPTTEKEEKPATDEDGKPTKSSEQVLEGLKTLGNLIVTNGEFRKLRTENPMPKKKKKKKILIDHWLYSSRCCYSPERYG